MLEAIQGATRPLELFSCYVLLRQILRRDSLDVLVLAACYFFITLTIAHFMLKCMLRTCNKIIYFKLRV